MNSASATSRLCRPDVRKASGFPSGVLITPSEATPHTGAAQPPPFKRAWHGKAKPFRTSGRHSRFGRSLFNLRSLPAALLNLKAATIAVALVALAALPACQSKMGGESVERGIVVVNAPAAGEVRRVFAREGMAVNVGDPLVEIAVRVEAPPQAPQPQTESPQARAAKGVTAAQAEVEAARAEVVRAEVEVQRLTPLVAAGQATQGELDGARALYDKAQQRLRRAQDSARDAQGGLVAARQPSQNAPPKPATPSEQIVPARASSAGTVSAISVKVGDRVTLGQPLATLRAGGN